MHVARQRGDKGHVGHVVLAVEDGLVQVGNGPALGNVEVEPLAENLSGLPGGGVAPGAEGGQQLALMAEGEVAVHHGGEAHGGHTGQLHPVAGFHVGGQVGVGILQPGPHVLQGVGPVAALIAVLPAVVAGGDGGVVRADEHRLDAGGAQLDAQTGLTVCEKFFHIHGATLL